MSITMDSQDLHGQLRGLCLVTSIRWIGGPIKSADLREVLGKRFGVEIEHFTAAAAAFSGIDVEELRSAVEELYTADDTYLQLENMNTQLGLLSGHPVPAFPFVEQNRVRDTALLRPFLDSSRNMIHSAVRLRMQTFSAAPAEAFWPAALRFLQRMGGDGPMARAIALSTIIDVASDIIFFNTDAPNRAEDPALAHQIGHVLDELTAVPVQMENLIRQER